MIVVIVVIVVNLVVNVWVESGNVVDETGSPDPHDRLDPPDKKEAGNASSHCLFKGHLCEALAGLASLCRLLGRVMGSLRQSILSSKTHIKI